MYFQYSVYLQLGMSIVHCNLFLSVFPMLPCRVYIPKAAPIVSIVQVYGVTWNPHLKDPSDFHFVTWGKKHCKLWTQSQNSRTSKSGSCHKDNSIQIISKQLSFGRFDLQNVHSAVFLPETHAMVLGLARGDLLVFSGTSAVRSISAHRSGPQFIADDGSVTFSGLRGLALHHGDTCLLTAGVLSINPTHTQRSRLFTST